MSKATASYQLQCIFSSSHLERRGIQQLGPGLKVNRLAQLSMIEFAKNSPSEIQLGFRPERFA